MILKFSCLAIAWTPARCRWSTLPAVNISRRKYTALEDDEVIKWAFNATFERICLSRFLGYPTGEYLNPKAGAAP